MKKSIKNSRSPSKKNGIGKKALGAAAFTARALNPLPTDAVSRTRTRFNRISSMWRAYRQLSGSAGTERRTIAGRYDGVALAFERSGRALGWLPLIGPLARRFAFWSGSKVGSLVQWIDQASVTTVAASMLHWLIVIGAAITFVGLLLIWRDGFTTTTVGVCFAGSVLLIRHCLLLLTLNIKKAKKVQQELSARVV